MQEAAQERYSRSKGKSSASQQTVKKVESYKKPSDLPIDLKNDKVNLFHFIPIQNAELDFFLYNNNNSLTAIKTKKLSSYQYSDFPSLFMFQQLKSFVPCFSSPRFDLVHFISFHFLFCLVLVPLWFFSPSFSKTDSDAYLRFNFVTPGQAASNQTLVLWS